MVATFVERSRKIQNVNDHIKTQANFVKMLFCKMIRIYYVCCRSG